MSDASTNYYRTVPYGYVARQTAFGPAIVWQAAEEVPEPPRRETPSMAIAEVRNRFVEYEIVARGYPVGAQGEQIAHAAGEKFDAWLKQLLAETWDQGASDYYGTNPFG